MVLATNVTAVGLAVVRISGRITDSLGQHSPTEEETSQDSNPHSSCAHSLQSWVSFVIIILRQ